MLSSRLGGTAWGAKYRVHLAVSSPTACIVAGASVSPSLPIQTVLGEGRMSLAGMRRHCAPSGTAGDFGRLR